VANDAERARWNDLEWVDSWTRREGLTDSVSPQLLRVADPVAGQRVCDLGCGGGNLSLALGRLVGPEGEVVGVDISAPLLEIARRRGVAARSVRFEQRDVQTDGLGGGLFDLAVSQFGVMFFDEPVVAFGAVRGGLRPEARFVFACWQGVERNPWHARAALTSLLPPSPAPGPGKSPVGPFVLSDDGYVHSLLRESGFSSVAVASFDTTVRGPAAAVVDRTQLAYMGILPERLDEAESRVLDHLREFSVGRDEYDFSLAFRIYDARNGSP
jgi:SAM-dependent methyltransferase